LANDKKFVVKNGLTTEKDVTANNVVISGSLSANGTIGTSGQTLRSDGTKSYWSTEVGYTGSQGSQGIIGYTGSRGFTGSRGDQGVIGYTGSRGDQGTTGFVGSKGDQGVIGFTGSKGTDGTTGFTGSAGGTVDYLRLEKTSFSENANVSKVSAVGVRWDNSVFKSNLYTHDTVTNAQTVTVGGDGIYIINCSVGTNNTGSARTTINGAVFVNGSIISGSESSNYSRGSGYGDAVITIATQLELSTNDEIEIRIWSDDSDTSDSVDTVAAECQLVISRISQAAATSGDTGFTGSKGFTGSAGTGFTGSRGSTGFTGSQGIIGYSGSAGTAASTGKIIAMAIVFG